MKYLSSIFATVVLFILALIYVGNNHSHFVTGHKFHDPIFSKLKENGEILSVKQMPNDWFTMQRSLPYESIPKGKYMAAIDQAKTLAASKNRGPLADIVWLPAGPTNIPGRITDLAVNPLDKGMVYAASGSGGIFKSVDSGQSWTAIFDSAGSQAIGAIALHPTNPDIIFAGTGEANSARCMYEGTGMYKSEDGGITWSYNGLPESYHIGRIVIDPTRPDTMYVAVGGKLFGANPERGVYRSIDGGENWERMLYIDDTTGCVDIALHPSTGTLLAAMWYRWRTPTDRKMGGLQSGVYKSTDYGESWNRLEGGLPLPYNFTQGRIGLTIDPLSQTCYAIYADNPGYFRGVYKSADLGVSWTRTNDAALDNIYSSYGWYFGNIRVVPGYPNVVFALGVQQFRTTNGGSSWHYADDDIHVDHHAIYIDSDNPNLIYNGNDGGVVISENMGSSWMQRYYMASTQFYEIAIDYNNPERLYGGAQDNGTMRTQFGGLHDWDPILGGDGFYCIVDYTDSDIIYAEYQWGYVYKSISGGSGWLWALGNIDYNNDRHNWNTPIVMDPNAHNTLYYGSNRLYRTIDGGDYWTDISGDLTNGPGGGYMPYGTITTICVSPINTSVIYVGTDDGNVWVTQNNGGDWTNISGSLPVRWITRVTADPHHANRAYVTLSGYKYGSPLTHVFITDNYGADWTPIHNNLPDAPVNNIIVDSDYDSLLYLASDVGVYYSMDLGANWEPLGQGIASPVVVLGLVFHPPTRTLVAGTYGRSMYRAIIDFGPDADEDGISDILDNCPEDYNPDQTDNDSDALGNECDNCPDVYNPGQEDLDSDSYGDLCDNCPEVSNPDQADANSNGVGDACDFICGDANNDRSINILDITFLINYLYKGGSAPESMWAADASGDGTVNILDVTVLISYLYKNGPVPVCQ